MKKRILTPIAAIASLMLVTTLAGCDMKLPFDIKWPFGKSSTTDTESTDTGSSDTTSTHVPEAFEGYGAPSNGIGEDGDTYVDLDTGIEYVKKGGKWVVTHVSEELSGEGAPDASIGQNGDTYVDTINGAEYVKQNGEWIQTRKGDTTYVVTFNLNGGKLANGDTTIPNQIVREGRWITEPASNPMKEHSKFLGWFVVGTEQTWSFKGTPVYGDVDLIAKYSVNEEDKITYTVDPNNGEATYTVETFIGDTSYPAAPFKAGYDFQGWKILSTGQMYNGTVTAAMNGETIVAQWEKAQFNVSYQVEANGEVTITGVLNIEAESVSIPDTINGRKVTKIAKKAFNFRTNIRTIYIPASVKLVEEGAFAGTWRLQTIYVDSASPYYTSVNGILFSKSLDTLVCYPTKAGASYTVPASVTRIAAYAFYESKDMGLTSINFSEGLVEIGDYAFYMNETISSITFPKSLRRIGKAAFLGTTFTQEGDDYASPQGVLQVVKFNDGLEEIGDSAFANQYFKDTFELPSSVKVIEPYAFANCTAIVTLVIPANLETFAPSAFNGCTGILEIKVADDCKNYTVQDKILYTKDMKTLVLCPSGRTAKVTVPEGVTALGDFAFYMVDELQEYEFPSSLKVIGRETFAQTYHLNAFRIPDSVESIGEDCFYQSGVSTMKIGTGLQAIPEGAFNDTKIRNIDIPGNVKTIEGDAFGSSPLTSATLLEGVTTIKKSAFAGCSSLATVTLPESITTIGNSAFANSKVKTLYIGKNVTSIGVDICYNYDAGSTSLESLTVSSENANYTYQNNILFTKDKTTLLFATNKIGSSVIIPEGVQKIGDSAFAKLSTVTSYSFPSTLVEIGEGAFTYCKASSLTFPSSLRKIGEGAFYFAYTGSVTFNEGLQEIGAYSFRLSDIKTLSIPDSVKTIGDYAFYQTMMLTSQISLGSGVETIGEGAFMNSKISGTLTIPASVTSIGDGAFTADISTYGPSISSIVVEAGNANYASGSNLLMNKAKDTVYGFASAQKSIVVPEGVTTIANYGLAAGGNSIGGCLTQSISLPSTLTTIGYAGLFGQAKVAAINVPASVTSVGDYAFSYWTASQAITFNCSRAFALENFAPYFLSGCSATVKYQG